MDKSIKQMVEACLIDQDYDRLLALHEEDRRIWKALRAYLYETNENISWPAIEAIARLMQRWWKTGQQERVRNYIRNLFWSLNDESGGIGWNAPQTIAEIIVQIPELNEPYGTMILDRTLGEPPLVNSCLWAIGRLGNKLQGSIEIFADAILEILESESAQAIGLAAWAMGRAGFEPALPLLESFGDRNEPVRIYIEGTFVEKSVREWSKEAIEQIRASAKRA